MVDVSLNNVNINNSRKENGMPFQVNPKYQKKISIFKAYQTFCTKKLFFCLMLGILGSIGGGITNQLLEYFSGELISKLNDNSSNNDVILHNVKKIYKNNYIYYFNFNLFYIYIIKIILK